MKTALLSGFLLSISLSGALSGATAFAANTKTDKAVETSTEVKEDGTKVTKHTRYRAQQTLDFENQVIQGGVKRPESSVVTGNRDEVTDGLLSLREDFLDHAQADAGVAN